MRPTTRDPAAPRKRRSLLRALSETPVRARRSGRLAGSSPHLTLGVVMRRDPVYAPATSLLGRLDADKSGGCPPPRRRVLVAARVDHPPHDGVDPLVGIRPLRPARAAANLLHQVLAGLWSLDDVPAAEVPESGSTADECGGQRPPRSAAPLESQVPPAEEVVEVAEPPQAEARTPQTCDRPCGPVAPGARQLAAKAGKVLQLDPRCAGKHTFEGQYTPFTVDSPNERGKPSPPVEHESPCPCECVCTSKACVDMPEYTVWFGPLLDAIDPALAWLGCFLGGFLADILFPDSSVGCGYALDQAGTMARPRRGDSPALDALRGGQSAGLGIFAGRDLDLGLMRPALSLAALSTSGIPGPAALSAPEIPGENALILALRQKERSSIRVTPAGAY